MSKLFKLKEWLTIADAAKHLALVFGEDVSEADVLRFALDGALKLSANFVNGGRARVGRLIPISEATYEEVPSLVVDAPPVRLYGGPVLTTAGEETHVLKLDSHVVSLRGIFDLPMIGGERHDVEHQFQALTGGPAITMHSLDGAFVAAADGSIGQLQEDFDDNEYQAGSTASLEKLKQRIRNEKIPNEKADDLLKRHAEDRKDFLEKRKHKPAHEAFYPAAGLPDDCVIVVRTRSLTDFISMVNNGGRESERALSTRERDTLLKLILGMALGGYRYDPKAAKSSVPKEIVDDLAGYGLSITDDTVRKYLKEAADTVLSSNGARN